MSQYPPQQQPSTNPTNLYPQAPIGFQSYPQPMNVQQPMVVAAQLGDTPVRMVCPNCRNEIMTKTSNECSIIQHIAFFVMCITGICTICSCVPYCIDSLGQTRHECPNCKAHLGSCK